MNETLLQKLTIVIFSYNRHKYLKRTINYWSNYNVKLVILDGSNNKLVDPCLNSEKIKYIYDPKSLYARLLRSGDYIDTEFMILGCDDEFYLPSALSECIKFLLSEDSFSSCGGCAASFEVYKKEIVLSEMYHNLKNINLDHDSSAERIKSHFNNYLPAHLYSILRTNKWKLICKYVFEKEFSFYAAWEMQIEFLIMVSGKSKIIPELMWMRNIYVPSIRGTSPSMSQDVEIFEWWRSNNFKKEKEEFLYKMKVASQELSKDKNIKFTEQIISELFEIYISSQSAKIKQNKKYKKSFLFIFINFIPRKIKRFIKSILFPKPKIVPKGVSINYVELKNIISRIQYSISEN